MASQSEITFGSKVANAQKISTYLKAFTAYAAPTTNTTIVNYDVLIAATTTENTNIATKKPAYSAAVEVRQQLFFKDKDCVMKILSPILSALRAKLGKTAKPVADITSLVTKIRGEKKPKDQDPKPEDPNAEKKDPVSQSERSFGSITQNYSDIVTALVTLGTDYAPANNAYKLTTLQTKLTNITAATIAATNTFGALKTGLDNRLAKYTDLAERTQRIKESVKSQYGVKSSEYNLIKGLKV
jgi:hypothetical protein